MTGSRILLLVVLGTAGLAYLALGGGGDADVQRGREETDTAFALVEAELHALDDAYRYLLGQGLKLGIQGRHDQIRTAVADLRARRLAILADEALARRSRLPALRTLIEESDLWLAEARGFGASLSERAGFLRTAAPLLAQAERNRDRLQARPLQVEAQDTGRSALAATYARLRDRSRQADALLQRNVEQGRIFAGSVLSSLRSLLDGQRRLLQELERASPP